MSYVKYYPPTSARSARSDMPHATTRGMITNEHYGKQLYAAQHRLFSNLVWFPATGLKQRAVDAWNANSAAIQERRDETLKFLTRWKRLVSRIRHAIRNF